jgi:uncharacterized protein (DUF1697 family)
MNTYIVLLRGINVGGHKKISMAELREVLSKAGFDHVRTYIQSGNIIFQSSEKSRHSIEEKMQQVILGHFKFEVPVMARTRVELQQIFEACPFLEEEEENSYYIILSEIPKKELVDEVMQITYDNETFHIINDCLYFHSSIGYGNSKFNMKLFEKKLNVNATSRNYKTIVKLIAMSSENQKDH